VSRSEEAAKKLAEALDIPEDQVLPCVVAFACLRYHGKSFVRKLANGTGPITTWQSLKIGVALFLWGRAQKKDPWGELYRITKFAQAWKEGDSYMNDVKLSGRLTRDPELKQTPNGVPVATFALAVDRKFNREEADFIPVTTWRKTAEFVAKYFRKGQRVIIASGRIRVDPYTDKDGNKRTRFEVVAVEVEFAESRRAAEDQPAGSLAAGYMENEGFAEIDGEDGELPF